MVLEMLPPAGIAINTSRFTVLSTIERFRIDPTKTVIIIILDAGLEDEVRPVLKLPWNQRHIHRFSDLGKDEMGGISEFQARDIAETLQYARRNGLNVIAACTVGVSRSGGVVEAATLLGIHTRKMVSRTPNSIVWRKIASFFKEDVWDAVENEPYSRQSEEL